MEKKQIKVMAPEGFHFTGEVTNTEEGNTIALTFEEDEPKKITWEDIADKVGANGSFDAYTLKIANNHYYGENTIYTRDIIDMHNYMTAYSKLIVIAKYFNGDWKPELDLSNYRLGTSIAKTPNGYVPLSWECSVPYAGVIIFKDKQSCEEAIRIMGDELKYLFNY